MFISNSLLVLMSFTTQTINTINVNVHPQSVKRNVENNFQSRIKVNKIS